MKKEKGGEEHRGSGVSFGTDLGLELYRQHTLLSTMSGRLRETADALSRTRPPDSQRLERALEVHKSFLIEVHHEVEKSVDAALAKVRDPSVVRAIDKCRKEHPNSARFQDEVVAAMAAPFEPDEETPTRLAELFRREAGWIEEHHVQEEQPLYGQLDRLLSSRELERIVHANRELDAKRIAAEIALTAWASQLNPSSD
jgi:hemerythrin-like domain-containing protein